MTDQKAAPTASKGKTMTGASILWECLERKGVKVVFGYPGGAILPAYDALKGSKIHHILVRHEQGATHMADGFARASGEVGVAVATSGPGATNMVTGIATAMLDSIPIVCITGQVGSKLIGSDAFQETDITGVTLPITKHNYLVTHASEVARTIREAFYGARSGAGGYHQRCAAGYVRVRLGSGEAATAGLPARPFARSAGVCAGAGFDPQFEAAGDPCRSRHHHFWSHARGARFCRACRDSGRTHTARPGCAPRIAPAQSGHDGHARGSLGESYDSRSGSALGLRHAVRRPRHRHAENLRAQR